MIEVEKKFLLSKEDEVRLIAKARFIGEIKFTDTYYDTADLNLTLQDIWLRSRDDKYELKLPLHVDGKRIAYNELEDEAGIIAALKFVPTLTLSQNLKTKNFSPVCICKTTRRKYKQDKFNIDLDRVELRDSIYELAEIEVMVNEKSEMESAKEDIFTFAVEHGLKTYPVRGKVLEYLHRFRPEHYRALIKMNIIKDI